MDQLDFTYLNGHTIPLCECEDGFQSFIIMQLMLTHGCLDHETLVLVEFPDMFLSPCKIADYVRMCIWIHKEQGTRFVFSTYNRDVITAINHYYHAENLSTPLNYYIANNTRSTFNYSYHFSGNNVSPVLEYLKMELK
ncbi:MAG: hypothetical protein LUG51_07700 [Tannerellaceae bacterium]|nr:hypothetical protein [Tannerellaceae bacterium]